MFPSAEMEPRSRDLSKFLFMTIAKIINTTVNSQLRNKNKIANLIQIVSSLTCKPLMAPKSVTDTQKASVNEKAVIAEDKKTRIMIFFNLPRL